MKFTTLALVLAFAARDMSAALAAAAPELPQFTRSGDCAVPDVRGLDERSASAQLYKHDLTPVPVARHAPQPAGSVIAQQPAACSRRPANGRVEIVVSAGPRTSDIPSPQPEPPRRDGGGPSVGQVAVPIAVGVGIAVAAGLLSRRNSVDVPDLRTRPLDEATERLRRSQLRVGEITRLESPTAPAGTVMEQSPAAGTRVARDTIVDVRVSSGRPAVTVPDVTLLEWQEAEQLVTATGLRLVAMNAPAVRRPEAVVEAQVPEAGTRVVPGASVGVTLRTPTATVAVNQPPAPNQTPGPGPARGVNRPPAPSVAPAGPPAPGRGFAQPAGPPAATPPVPIGPSPSGAVPAGPAGAVPAVPDALQGLRPAADVPAAPPRVPVIEAPPAALILPVLLPGFWWPWLWLLLLAALGSLAWRYGRRPAGREVVPPVVARLTVVPRLDGGQQAITTIDGGRSRAFDLALHRDEGVQRLRSDDTPSRVVQIGAVS